MKLRILSWIGKKVTYIVENYLLALVILAVLGIISAIIGHYGQLGFDWRWFVFFELPLYIFIGWAISKCIKMYKEIEKTKENDRKRV